MIRYNSDEIRLESVTLLRYLKDNNYRRLDDLMYSKNFSNSFISEVVCQIYRNGKMRIILYISGIQSIKYYATNSVKFMEILQENNLI